MIRTTFQVNGAEVDLPYRGADGVTVKLVGGVYRLVSPCGFKAVWDPESLNSKIKILVPPYMAADLKGLCGNCNGQQDDMKTASGENGNMAAIGQSYRVE